MGKGKTIDLFRKRITVDAWQVEPSVIQSDLMFTSPLSNPRWLEPLANWTAVLFFFSTQIYPRWLESHFLKYNESKLSDKIADRNRSVLMHAKRQSNPRKHRNIDLAGFSHSKPVSIGLRVQMCDILKHDNARIPGGEYSGNAEKDYILSNLKFLKSTSLT